MTRFFMANAEDVPIDAQGRITIPKRLRAHAQLDRDVTISGMGQWIEIWNSELLDQELGAINQNLDGMRPHLSVSKGS